MTKVTLPFLDTTGKLTPLVLDAMANGATSANHPHDPNKIVLTFSTKAAAQAFEALIK